MKSKSTIAATDNTQQKLPNPMLTWMKYIVFALIGFFWFQYFSHHWQDIKTINWLEHTSINVLSLMLFILGYIVVGVLWAPFLFLTTGIRISVVESFSICAFSWAGRYIPGKIWTLATKATLSCREQSQLSRISLATFIEALLYIGSGATLCLFFLPFSGLSRLLSGNSTVIFTLLACSFLVLCHPRVTQFFINIVLKLMRRTSVQLHIPFHSVILMIVGYMLTFFLWSLAFMILTLPYSELSVTDIPSFTVLFTAAWLSGLLALFAPAGLGVRESVLAITLQQLTELGPSDIVTLTLGSRVLTTLAEAICLSAALIGKLLYNSSSNDSVPAEHL